MTRKTKILFGSIIGLIVIIAIVLILINFVAPFKPKPVGPTNTVITNEDLASTPLTPLTTPTNIEPPPPGPQEQNPQIVASDFAERYGSYSNQNNYQNLRDLYPQMTTAMHANTDAYIAANPTSAGDYQGTSTKTLRVEVLNQGDTTFRVKIYTQRTESTATNSQSLVYYQNAEATLIKSNLLWLVDSFVWQAVQ